jgi:hypothetical protein
MSNNPAPNIVAILPQAVQQGWDPIRGAETEELTFPPSVTAAGREMIIGEAVRILRRCVPPASPQGEATGLVVGYVQSGKTMSFTTVASLARDNGYRLVIVVSGTKNHLLAQSRDRLLNDLRVNRAGYKPWRHVENPTAGNATIRDTLAEWQMNMPAGLAPRSMLVTVLKNVTHLNNLTTALTGPLINLQGVPTLIIDDEADQASLNNRVREGDTTPTYDSLLALKRVLPHHSFIQYTATPQAPLLINIIDVLSPDFADVLTPGDGYVGGRDFFRPPARHIQTIPAGDIPSRGNTVTAPPESLQNAMRLFFLGAAAGLIAGNANDVRSMMVHPSQATSGHEQSSTWVNAVRNLWMQVLGLAANDPDRIALISLFQLAYNDLQTTEPNIAEFEILAAALPVALLRTRIEVLNYTATNARDLNWNDTYPWILVGGNAMDRGFTVSGLTVTYMPRSLGAGNADTVQQRARFFGYKRDYFGYCRVFLGQDVRNAFERYVASEEDIRQQLIEHRDTGQPLSVWRREFFSPRGLRPTRQSVVDIGYLRIPIPSTWHFPNGPHDTPEAIQDNRALFTRIRQHFTFVQHNGLDLRHDSPRNQVAANLSLQMVHEELLSAYRFPRPEDTEKFIVVLRMIQVWLVNHPQDRCSVFLIGNGTTRLRGYSHNAIDQPFQGPQYAQQPGGGRQRTYPGDREVRSATGVSIQLQYLTLHEKNNAANIYAQDIPFIAVYIPPEMAQDEVQQAQGGQP